LEPFIVIIVYVYIDKSNLTPETSPGK